MFHRSGLWPIKRLCTIALCCGLLMLDTGERTATAAPATAAAPAIASDATFYATPFERRPGRAALVALGRALFFQPALSASGRMSCASCHDPSHAYGPANALPVQRGGVDMTRPGLRAVPSLMYQQDTPRFSEHFIDPRDTHRVDQGPAGGRGWDGRVFSAHEQAALPLLSPFEMANTDRREVVQRLQRSPVAADFRLAFGRHVFDDVSLSWNGLVWALEVFQQSPTDFYPYTSKYDAYLRRQVELTRQEQRGLALFNDEAKGNCAACHPSAVQHGDFPQFTDRGFSAIGVPRNAKIPANADPRYHDLGLCGPVRDDLPGRHEYCGLFKAPTLRNSATRTTFFHNGALARLKDVVAFYAERDVRPDRWFPRRSDGHVALFDDLPGVYQGNVETKAPFGRHPGQRAALSASEQRDLVVFLGTLTDGFRPEAPHRRRLDRPRLEGAPAIAEMEPGARR